MWARLLAGAIALGAAQAGLVAIVAALRPGRNIYVTVVGAVLLSAPLAWIGGDWIAGAALSSGGRAGAVLLHLALGGYLFQFMTLPDRSVTLRMLVELADAPGGRLTVDEMDARYGVRGMIESRLRQLQDGDCLTIGGDGAVTLTPRGERFGRAVATGRRLFGIESAN